MKLKQKYIYLAFFFVILGALISTFTFGLFFAEDPKTIPSALINKPAPSFTLNSFKEKKITLDSFQGEPLVLNFFASWCVPCRRESQELEKVWQKYQGQINILSVAVNDSTEAAKKFIQENKVSFPAAKDDLDGSLSIDYGVTGIPETFFINSEGIIKDKVLGAVDSNKIEEFLNNL